MTRNQAKTAELVAYHPFVLGDVDALAAAHEEALRHGIAPGDASCCGLATYTRKPQWATIAKECSRFAGLRVRYDPGAHNPRLQAVPRQGGGAGIVGDDDPSAVATVTANTRNQRNQIQTRLKIFKLLLS